MTIQAELPQFRRKRGDSNCGGAFPAEKACFCDRIDRIGRISGEPCPSRKSFQSQTTRRLTRLSTLATTIFSGGYDHGSNASDMSATSFTINSSNSNSYGPGAMADFRVYARALSGSEINGLASPLPA